MSDTVDDPNQALIDQITDLTARVVSLERAPWQNIVTSGAALAAGDIIIGGSSRVGCLLCDGSVVSRTDQAGIFAVWGTTFGVGDGSTTFDLPDFRGVVPIGAGTGVGLTARTLGVQVGAETVTLTGAQSGIAQHLHAISGATGSTTPGATGSAGSHNHGPGTGTSFVTAQTGGTGTFAAGSTNFLNPSVTDTEPAHTHTSAAHTHTLPNTDNVAAANAAQAHANVQPSLPVNFWIKT